MVEQQGINMKKRLTNREIADKHRLDFMAQSDGDINHFAISVMGDSFTTVGEHVKKEAKKLVDSQPF
jgi:hypothetical protein